jgi:sulfatase maturation enzyme AslB (radical SAM superfamily)
MWSEILLVIVALCVLLLIMLLKSNSVKTGGSEFKYKSMVIDTLNMTHEIHRKNDKYKISHSDIMSTIKTVTKKLKPLVSDKIIFVTKNRSNGTDEEIEAVRTSFGELSKKLKVYIYLVEKLPDRPGDEKNNHHAALGRDDFYAIITAWKLRCPVLGQDYYKDLKNMKYGELDSFHVRQYIPFKKYEVHDYVNPTGLEYRKVRRPRVIRWEDVSL